MVYVTCSLPLTEDPKTHQSHYSIVRRIHNRYPPDADALSLVREVRSSLKVERLHLSLRGAEEPLQAPRGRDAPSTVGHFPAAARDVARLPAAPDLGGANGPLARRPRRSRAMHGKFGAS